MNEPKKCLYCDAAELTPHLALCQTCRDAVEDTLRIRRVNKGLPEPKGPMLP